MTKTDVILKSLNRINEGKRVIKKDEFANLIELVGNLFINKIRKGNVDINTIEGFENYLDTLKTDNYKYYFAQEHDNVKEVSQKLSNNIQVLKSNFVTTMQPQEEVRGFSKTYN